MLATALSFSLNVLGIKLVSLFGYQPDAHWFGVLKSSGEVILALCCWHDEQAGAGISYMILSCSQQDSSVLAPFCLSLTVEYIRYILLDCVVNLCSFFIFLLPLFFHEQTSSLSFSLLL